MIPDLVVILMDVILLAMDQLLAPTAESAASGARSLKVARALRLLRLLRLVRLRKVGQVVAVIMYRCYSETLILVGRIAVLVSIIVAINHYVACAWYAISLYSLDGGWAEFYLEDGASFGLSYLVALHWALTQFSPATNNIAPRTIEERAFACMVVLFALVVFSSFVSKITNSVNQLRTLNIERYQEEARIRQFIGVRRISADLGGRIQQFFHQSATIKDTAPLLESQIKFFELMPESMRVRLHEEMYMPVLHDSIMLQPFIRVDRFVWSKICHLAVFEVFVMPRQDVFKDGTPADTYWLNSGASTYFSRCLDWQTVRVENDSWLSEIALWASWNHCGSMVTDAPCNLLRIDANQFRDVVTEQGGALHSAFQKLAIFLCSYAEKLNAIGAVLPVTDLPWTQESLQTEVHKAVHVFGMQARREGAGGPMDDDCDVDLPEPVRHKASRHALRSVFGSTLYE
eukprot:gb/GFBE01057707.1/.p1 GENE.gb/GFBE01057707.1/~~gb/GFBE01057707.1/.p1  ORF type:complete len:459 (+),score=59.94 gb/GFBE01057707.1/:1-1377(+)